MIMFVASPGFGTDEGGRRSCSTLRNMSRLILTHLQDPDHHVIIDGAAGSPAWKHEGLDDLRKHSRWQTPKSYFWCAGGILFDDKPLHLVGLNILVVAEFLCKG